MPVTTAAQGRDFGSLFAELIVRVLLVSLSGAVILIAGLLLLPALVP